MPENEYKPVRTPRGGVMQSAFQKKRLSAVARSPQGLLVRGVVVQNVTADEESSPLINDPRFNQDPVETESPVVTGSAETYVQILVYSGIAGGRQSYLPNVLVTHEYSGMHEGDLSLPRAARVDVKGFISQGSNPADLDGDHVLVGFLDDNYNLPVLVRSIPHPNSDVGKAETEALGVRTRVQRSDGEPRFMKHRGAYWGVDTDGNWTTDLTKAHSGAYNADGTEPDPAQNGQNGNYTINVQENSTLTINATNGTQIRIDGDGNIDIDAGSDAKVVTVRGSAMDVQTDEVKLGDGAVEAAVLGDSWQTAHGTYDTALLAFLDGLYLTLLAGGPTPTGDGTLGASMLTALGGLTPLVPALQATLSSALAAPNLKSNTVKVKD